MFQVGSMRLIDATAVRNTFDRDIRQHESQETIYDLPEIQRRVPPLCDFPILRVVLRSPTRNAVEYRAESGRSKGFTVSSGKPGESGDCIASRMIIQFGRSKEPTV
ncbi:MAG: hypothetical protein Fues2KO_03650 [Fuerstiella sp.]